MESPEIWQYEGRSLTIHQLRDGRYDRRDRSLALPPLTSTALTQFLNQRFAEPPISENPLLKQFRQWRCSQSTAGESCPVE